MKEVGKFITEPAEFLAKFEGLVTTQFPLVPVEGNTSFWKQRCIIGTMLLFFLEDDPNHLYFNKASTKNYFWGKEYRISVQTFSESEWGCKGQCVTITLFRTFPDLEKDPDLFCEITFVNHEHKGLLQKIQIGSKLGLSDLQDLISFTSTTKEFCEKILS